MPVVYRLFRAETEPVEAAQEFSSDKNRISCFLAGNYLVIKFLKFQNQLLV